MKTLLLIVLISTATVLVGCTTSGPIKILQAASDSGCKLKQITHDNERKRTEIVCLDSAQ